MQLLVRAMDPTGTGLVSFDRFAACLYALSLQSREVGEPTRYAVFPDSAFSVETASDFFKVKRRLWQLLDDPGSSVAARWVAVLLTSVVLASVAAFIAESYPQVSVGRESAFSAFELACVIVFSAEYVARLGCTPEPHRFLLSAMNGVDLLAIVPFYLDLAFAGLGASAAPLLRAVRLVRVLRLVKLGRYVTWVRIFVATIDKSAAPLGMLAFVTATMVVFWASVGYYVERGTWEPQAPAVNGTDATTAVPLLPGGGEWINAAGTSSAFSSIPASFWWAIVSMSTVGYGDTYAVTAWGRALSAAAVLTGILLLAIPISIVTGNLHAEYDRADKLRALRAAHAAQPPPAPLTLPPPAAESVAATTVADAVEAAAAETAPVRASDAPLENDDNPSIDTGAGTGLFEPTMIPPSLAQKSLAPRLLASVSSSPPSPVGRRSAILPESSGAAKNEGDVAVAVPEKSLSAAPPVAASVQLLEVASTATTRGPPLRRRFDGVHMVTEGGGSSSSSDPYHSLVHQSLADIAAETGGGGSRSEGRRPRPASPRMGLLPEEGEEGEGGHNANGLSTGRTQGVESSGGATGRTASMAPRPPHRSLQPPPQPQLPASTVQARLDAAWSEPYLRSTLQVIRGSRRRLMSSLKALELRNREHAAEEWADFVQDLTARDRVRVLLQAASRSGLA